MDYPIAGSANGRWKTLKKQPYPFTNDGKALKSFHHVRKNIAAIKINYYCYCRRSNVP